MDNFAEQLVRREPTGSDKAKTTGILIGGVAVTVGLAVVSFLSIGSGLFPFIGFILAAAAGYGTFFLLQSFQVEYEYTFTNGELDVDKIIAQKRRKSLLSVDIRKFTDFGKYDDSIEESDDMTVIIASDNIASGEWFADFQHDVYGSARLVFSPDERMLENVKRSLPGKLRAKLQ